MSTLHRIHAPGNTGIGNAAAGADVVFVHGLVGNLDTWRSGGDPSNSFPHWLAHDFPAVNVWSLEYAASRTKWAGFRNFFSDRSRNAGHGMSLPDRALQLLDQMVQYGLGERPLFFICHSLGGLLVKKILHKSAEDLSGRFKGIFANTRAVLFLATPHAGADLASLLSAFQVIFQTTVTVQDLKAHDAHLRELFNWYRNHAPGAGIRTATYFELRSVKGLTIVNPTSSHPGVGDDPVGLDEDHISIARPAQRDTQVYRAASKILRTEVLARKQAAAPRPESSLPPSAAITVNIDAAALAHSSSFPPPLELPPGADEFFGREAELRELIDRLRSRENTAVVGPAGLGKTALAANALRATVGDEPRLLAQSPFPGGVVFLDLYTVGAAAEPVWDRLANRLGGPAFLERSPARERATAACAGRSALIVIEGGEEADGQQGRPAIHELFSVFSSQNRWLLLTRLVTQALSSESIHLKEALSPENAARLFDSIAKGRTPPDVREQALNLLDGHPLALTWAANLLARDDDEPQQLLNDWVARQLPALSDPTRAEHTLEWLFSRSLRGLDDNSRRALTAAGLLARAPFPLEAIEAVLGDSSARPAVKNLVNSNLLTRAKGAGCWQFTHVLGYRFARLETGSDPLIRDALGRWLHARITTELAAGKPNAIGDTLEHLGALLRADDDQVLWEPLAKDALYSFVDRLTDLGGLTQVKRLLGSVESWLQQLASGKAREPYWLRERSVVAERQGDVLLAQGDLAGALRAYRDSEQVSRRLAEADPSNAGWQRDLSVSNNKVGNVLLAQGDLAGALRAYRDSEQVRRRLAEADPSNAGWQRDLSVSNEKIGNVLLDQGDLAGALRAYRDSEQVRRRLAEADPSNAGWQRDLSVSNDNVGNVLLAQGDLPGALRAYRDSEQVRRRLAEADPSNAGWQRDLSVSNNKVGDVLLAQGDLAGALRAYRDSEQVRRRLAEADPSNAGWQRDLSVSNDNVGNVLLAQGDLAGALRAYRDSEQVSRRLADADPSNAGWQRDLSVSNDNVGNVLLAQGDLAGALRAYRDSEQVRRRLAEADPSNAGWQRDLSVSNEKIGNVLLDQGDLAGALRAYRDAEQVSRRLAEADPSNAGWQRDLSVSNEKIGNVLLAQGDLAGALRAYRDSEQVRRRLAGADPSNAGWQRDLSVSNDNVGNVLLAQGDLAGALRAYRDSEQVRRRLADADPSNAGWQRDLSVSNDNVGDVLLAQGDLAGALRAYRDSEQVRRRLAEADPSNAGWQRDQSVSNNKVGNVLLAQGDLAGALRAYRDSEQLSRRLAEADPSNAGWQRDLSYSITRLAQCNAEIGDAAAALRLAKESLLIDERLAALDPTNATWRQDVKVSRNLVAGLQR